MDNSKYITTDQIKGILKNAPQNVDKAQLVDYIASKGYTIQGFNDQNTQQQPKHTTFLDRLKSSAIERGSQIAQGVDKITHPQAGVDSGPFSKNNVSGVAKIVGGVAGGLNDLAGNVAEGIDNTVTGGQVLPAFGKAVAPVVKPAMEVVDAVAPEGTTRRDVLDAGANTLGALGTFEGAGVAKDVGTKAIVNTGKATVKLGENAVNIGTDFAKKVIPDSESIMQSVARIPKNRQAAFEKAAGESIGSFLDKRGIYGDSDQIIEQLYNRHVASKAEADKALSNIQGVFQPEPVKTALTDLREKLTKISAPGAIDPELKTVDGLLKKLENKGLTMTEINDAKRIYERKVKLDFIKENNVDGVARANNIDEAMRSWQFAAADKYGLKNLPEINKETRLTRQLVDDLGKEVAGSAGNNVFGLTDAILAAGGNLSSLGLLALKKVLSSKKIYSKIAKTISKNKNKINGVEAEIKQSNFKPINSFKDFTESIDQKTRRPKRLSKS